MEVQQCIDAQRALHLEQVARVLALPPEASGLHWHPFGVYTIPMAKHRDEQGTWSRRLHLWHPLAKPVGEASPYGVHTHSGPARSHVLVGSLFHHLYAFQEDPEGIWQESPTDRRCRLLAHVWEETRAGSTHDLPKDHPHGVSKPDGWAISLFEQLDGPAEQPFTTWQRSDVPAEELVRRGPVPIDDVWREARLRIDQAIVG